MLSESTRNTKVIKERCTCTGRGQKLEEMRLAKMFVGSLEFDKRMIAVGKSGSWRYEAERLVNEKAEVKTGLNQH